MKDGLIVAAAAALLMTGGCSQMQTKPAGTGASDTATAAPSSATAARPRKRDNLENVPLIWRPTTSLAKLGSLDLTDVQGAKIQVLAAPDTRQNPGFIGQNLERDVPRKVTTTDDVAAFVADRARMLLIASGFKVVDSGATAVVKLEVKAFFVNETSTYQGDVRLAVTVSDPSGKLRWNGVAGGEASRFGRSYKADNYYETLSDSLIEAVFSLAQNQGFRQALAGKS
jgi:hypothetical protein